MPGSVKFRNHIWPWLTVLSCLSGEATDTFGIAPDDSSRFASNAKIAGAFACDPGSTAGSGVDSQFLQIPCPFLSLPLHGNLHFQIQVARCLILSFGGATLVKARALDAMRRDDRFCYHSHLRSRADF